MINTSFIHGLNWDFLLNCLVFIGKYLLYNSSINLWNLVYAICGSYIPSNNEFKEFERAKLNFFILKSSKVLYLIVLISFVCTLVLCWIEINTGKWSEIFELISPDLKSSWVLMKILSIRDSVTTYSPFLSIEAIQVGGF